MVVGVAADDNPGLVAGRLRALGVTYPNLLDGFGSEFSGAYQVSDLPRTFVLDRSGRVRFALVGAKGGGDRLRAAVDRVLAARD